MSTGLELEDVAIRRGRAPGTVVVSGVSFSVDAGSVFGLLGPNACGKTSLLRAICGLCPLAFDPHTGRVPLVTWGTDDRWMTGRILRDGVDITAAEPAERGLGLVPQDLGLFPQLNVLENIAFPLRCRGVTATEATKRAVRLAERFGLTSVTSCLPARLSGGQRQRVAVARALVGGSRTVLLDEPLAAVDATGREELLRFLASALREDGASAIYVTHDPREAAAVCDKVGFIHDGMLQQVATPTEAYRAPDTLQIARTFAGMSNVIPGVLESSTRFRLGGEAHVWELPSGTGHEYRGVGPATLAIRPEAIRATLARRGVEARVLAFSFREGQTLVNVSVGTSPTVTCTIDEALARSRPDTVWLEIFDASALKLFDPSGRRMIG